MRRLCGVVGDGPGLLCPYPTIPAVFAALEGGQIEAGVVPVENSLEGSVVQTMDYSGGEQSRSGSGGGSHSH
ncbi:MAG: prephenate dehydratase domain-containing protein [Limnochordia bacterium]